MQDDYIFSILIGSVVVYVCGIHDILDSMFFHNSYTLFIYSVFVYHIGMVFIQLRRYSLMYTQFEQSNVMLEVSVRERTLELEEQTGTPIVAMTANIMSQDRELYRMNGMPDCVGKPFTSQQLWKCLLQYLKPVSMETTKKAAQDQADLFLQKRFQVNFLKDNQTIIEKIAGAMATGDMAVAHRLAHTLKGNAALIGKTGLQEAAADAEKILKTGKPLSVEQMSLLKTELDTVLNQLAALQARAQTDVLSSAQVAVPGIKTPDEIMAALERLETMFKNRDPECMVFLDTIRSMPETELLVKQVENFDFTPALMTISALKEGLTNNK